jgi:hypothetical protein
VHRIANPQTSLCTTSKVPVTARAVESCPCRSNIRGSRMTLLSRRPSGILCLSIAKSKSNLSCSVTHTSQKATDKEPASGPCQYSRVVTRLPPAAPRRKEKRIVVLPRTAVWSNREVLQRRTCLFWAVSTATLRHQTRTAIVVRLDEAQHEAHANSVLNKHKNCIGLHKM